MTDRECASQLQRINRKEIFRNLPLRTSQSDARARIPFSSTVTMIAMLYFLATHNIIITATTVVAHVSSITCNITHHCATSNTVDVVEGYYYTVDDIGADAGKIYSDNSGGNSTTRTLHYCVCICRSGFSGHSCSEPTVFVDNNGVFTSEYGLWCPFNGFPSHSDAEAFCRAQHGNYTAENEHEGNGASLTTTTAANSTDVVGSGAGNSTDGNSSLSSSSPSVTSVFDKLRARRIAVESQQDAGGEGSGGAGRYELATFPTRNGLTAFRSYVRSLMTTPRLFPSSLSPPSSSSAVTASPSSLSEAALVGNAFIGINLRSPTTHPTLWQWSAVASINKNGNNGSSSSSNSRLGGLDFYDDGRCYVYTYPSLAYDDTFLYCGWAVWQPTAYYEPQSSTTTSLGGASAGTTSVPISSSNSSAVRSCGALLKDYDMMMGDEWCTYADSRRNEQQQQSSSSSSTIPSSSSSAADISSSFVPCVVCERSLCTVKDCVAANSLRPTAGYYWPNCACDCKYGWGGPLCDKTVATTTPTSTTTAATNQTTTPATAPPTTSEPAAATTLPQSVTAATTTTAFATSKTSGATTTVLGTTTPTTRATTVTSLPVTTSPATTIPSTTRMATTTKTFPATTARTTIVYPEPLISNFAVDSASPTDSGGDGTTTTTLTFTSIYLNLYREASVNPQTSGGTLLIPRHTLMNHSSFLAPFSDEDSHRYLRSTNHRRLAQFVRFLVSHTSILSPIPIGLNADGDGEGNFFGGRTPDILSSLLIWLCVSAGFIGFCCLFGVGGVVLTRKFSIISSSSSRGNRRQQSPPPPTINLAVALSVSGGMLLNYFLFAFQSMAVPFGVFCGILLSDSGDAVADTDFSFVITSSQATMAQEEKEERPLVFFIPVRLLRAASDEPSWYATSWALSLALFALLLVVIIVLSVFLVTAVFRRRPRDHSDQHSSSSSSFVSAATTAVTVYNPLSLVDQYQFICALPKMPAWRCFPRKEASSKSEATSPTGTNTANIPFYSTSMASAWKSMDTRRAPPAIEEDKPEVEELVLVSLNSELSTFLSHPTACHRQLSLSKRGGGILSRQSDVTLVRVALASIIEDSALLSNVCEHGDGREVSSLGHYANPHSPTASRRPSPLSAFIKGGLITFIKNTLFMRTAAEISQRYPHFVIPMLTCLHVVFLPILLFVSAMCSTCYILQSDGDLSSSAYDDAVEDKTYLLPMWLGIALLFYGFGVVFLLFRPFVGILHNFNEALCSSLVGILLLIYALVIITTTSGDGCDNGSTSSLDSLYASRTIPLIVGCICNCRFPFLLSRWFFGMRLPPKIIITTRGHVDASVDYAITIRRQQRAADKRLYGNGRKKRTEEDQRWNGEEIGGGGNGTEEVAMADLNEKRLTVPVAFSVGDQEERESGVEMSERHFNGDEISAAAAPDDQAEQWDYSEYFQQQHQQDESGNGDYNDSGYHYHDDPAAADYTTDQHHHHHEGTVPTWPHHNSDEGRATVVADGPDATIHIPRRGGRYEYHEQTDMESRQRLQDEYMHHQQQYGGGNLSSAIGHRQNEETTHHQDFTL